MFTVCPKCALTLAVTAADLRIAQGYVRCGRCLNVFNALARLSEERPSASPSPQDATPPPSPADAIPSPQADATTAEPPAQAAAPPPQPSEQSSAFDDTGEIEIELEGSVLVTASRGPAAPEPSPALSEEPPGTETRHREAREAAGIRPPESQALPEEAASGPQPEPGPPQEKTEGSPMEHAPPPPETNTSQPESGFELQTPRPRAGLAWKLGAGALAIALALQVINHYRDALAANPALRGPMSSVYSALGVKLAPLWNIHAYDVRQLGASVAGPAAGEIVVRASVKNSADRAQPLPLLRVTLQDRFGNRIAARDVPPGDYLPSSVSPGSLLAAGSRVDATMTFVDPGPQAVGFEIDACLPQHNGAVACAHGP